MLRLTTRSVIKQAPFRISEKGWGEFEMLVTLTPLGAPKGGDTTIIHDLNFMSERYEAVHPVVSEWSSLQHN